MFGDQSLIPGTHHEGERKELIENFPDSHIHTVA